MQPEIYESHLPGTKLAIECGECHDIHPANTRFRRNTDIPLVYDAFYNQYYCSAHYIINISVRYINIQKIGAKMRVAAGGMVEGSGMCRETQRRAPAQV